MFSYFPVDLLIMETTAAITSFKVYLQDGNYLFNHRKAEGVAGNIQQRFIIF